MALQKGYEFQFLALEDFEPAIHLDLVILKNSQGTKSRNKKIKKQKERRWCQRLKVHIWIILTKRYARSRSALPASLEALSRVR